MDDKRTFARHAIQLLVAFGLSAPLALAQTTAPAAPQGEADGAVAKGVGQKASEATEDSALAESSEGEPSSEETTEGSEQGATQSSDSEESPATGGEGEAETPKEAEEGLAELDSDEQKRTPAGEPALTDTEQEAPLEDQDDWLKWPFSRRNQDYPKQSEPHRWASAGAFVGWVSRPSESNSIKYRPGIAWGGYLRPELASWMGLRLFYREERIPVQVEQGAFDYDEDTYDDKFEQGDIEILNLGARLEPTLVVHPRFRVRGIVGWSWLWFQAPFPKSEEFELKRTFRSAVQMDLSLGAGLSLDIVKNWVDISLDSAYSVPAGRTGTAYKPAQIVRDGVIRHIAPIPKLQNSVDFVISLGVIL